MNFSDWTKRKKQTTATEDSDPVAVKYTPSPTLGKTTRRDDKPSSFSEWTRKKNGASIWHEEEIGFNSWLDDLGSFSTRVGDDYAKRDGVYQDTASLGSYRDSTYASIDGLSKHAEEYQDYFTTYRDAYNEQYGTQTVDGILSALSEGENYLRSVQQDLGSEYDYWGQFEDEDAYNAQLQQHREYERLSAYDVAAGQASMEALEAQLAQVKQNKQDIQRNVMNFSRADTTNEAGNDLLVPMGQIDEIEAQMTAIERDREQAQRIQQQLKYAAYQQESDFAQFSAKGAAIENPSINEAENGISIFGWNPFAQPVNNVVTYSRDNWEAIAMAEFDGSQAQGKSIYQHMTQNEVDIHNYLLAKHGGDAAKEYLRDLEETLNYRLGTQTGENIRGIESNLGRTLATGMYGIGAGLDQFGSGMRQLASSERLPTTPTQFGSAYIREDLAETGPEIFGSSVGQIGYDLTTTAANMAPSILLSAVTAGAGAPAAVATGAGAATLGSSAGGNAYNQALGEGYTKGQAKEYALLIGASEASLQYLLGGIGALGGRVTGTVAQTTIQNIDNALLRIAANVGIRMAGEGTEEYVQELLNPVFRNMVLDENNEIRLVSEETAYSFLLGALTAGFLESGSVTRTTTQMGQTGAAIRSAGQYDALLENALTLEQGSQAYQMANKMQNGTLHTSDINVGQLFADYAQMGGDLSFMEQAEQDQAGDAAADFAGQTGTQYGTIDTEILQGEEVGYDAGELHSVAQETQTTADTRGGDETGHFDRFLGEARQRGQEERTFPDGQSGYRYLGLSEDQISEGARAVQTELDDLGVPNFVHGGDLETFRGGIIGAPKGAAVTIGGDAVGVRNDIVIPPRETAGHEAYHYWSTTPVGQQYFDTVQDSIDFSSEIFREFADFIQRGYLEEGADLSMEGVENKLLQELVAYVSGYLHDESNAEILRPMLRDYDGAQLAWQDLVEAGRRGKGTGATHQTTAPTAPQEAMPSTPVDMASWDFEGLSSAQRDSAMAAARESFGENGVKGFELGLRPGVNPAAYYQDFTRAYNAGLTGRKQAGVARGTLTDAQQGVAFAAGRSDGAASLAKEKRGAQFAKTAGRDSGLVFDDYVANTLDRAMADRVNNVAKLLGTRVQFVDSVAQGTANAQINGAQVLIEKNNSNPVLYLLGHEWTHRLQELAPEEYRRFARAALEHMGGVDGRVEARKAEYAKGNEPLNNLEAMDELVSDYAGKLLEDGALLDQFIQRNQHKQGLLQQLRDAIASLVERLTGKHKDQAARVQRLLGKALDAGARQEAKVHNGQKNTAQEGGGTRYSLNQDFGRQFDDWLARKQGNAGVGRFLIGTTSHALRSIGMAEHRIYWNKAKIAKIMKEHPSMTADVIKNVPNILESPILVMQSQTVVNRITLFGETVDKVGKPVLAVLELSPENKIGEIQDFAIIASAYGKDNAQRLINQSDILYVDPDKNRTNSWLGLLRLQLPSSLTSYGSIHSVTYATRDVNGNISFGETEETGSKSAVEMAFERALEKKRGTNMERKNLVVDTEDGLGIGRDSLKGAGVLDGQINEIVKKAREENRDDAAIGQEIRTLIEQHYQVQLDQFGQIPAGERPARAARVPKRTTQQEKVSQTVRTILEAKATPEIALPELEALVARGEFSYEVYSDEQAIADATATIEDKGYATALAHWMADTGKGEVSKANTALGWALYNAAANSGDIKSAMTVLTNMVDHQRNAAQAVQATRILKQLSPEGQLYSVQRSAENLKRELKERYGKKAPDIQINEALARQLLEARDQKQRDKALGDLYRDIGRQMPSTFMDKWNAWRYLAMLGNARTHIRNVVGNGGFAPVVAMKNLTATAIEAAVGRVSGGKMGRTKAFVGAGKADRQLLAAAWRDYDNVAEQTLGGGKYNDMASANRHIEAGRVIFRTKPLEQLRRGNSKLLDREDVWFSRPHYAAAMAQYCKANGITAAQMEEGKAIDTARAYAIKEAQKATYRDTNAFSLMMSGLGRYSGRNPMKRLGGIVLEGILPFRKTPANILVRGLEYSPLGLLRGLSYDLYQVQRGALAAAEAIDHIAAGLTGTGLLGLGIYLAAQGLVRGAGGDDEERRKFEELQGHQAYALELPNGTSVTLDWLAPEALPFFVGVNLWEQKEAGLEGTTMAELLAAVGNVTQPMLEMSCLQSLNDAFDSVGYAGSQNTSALMAVLSSAATSYLTQGIPTLLGQLERTAQESRVTTYPEKDNFLTKDMQYALGRGSARIPGWDYGQIPYIDAWGRKETQKDVVARGVDNLFNPAFVDTMQSSALEGELLRLYEATGEGKVLPERAASYFTVNQQRRDLTGAEYVRYATAKGQTAYQLLGKLVAGAGYSALDDAQKIAAVAAVYEYANATAKMQVSAYKPEGWVAKAMQTSRAYDIPPQQYISVYLAQKTLGSIPDRDGEAIPNSRGLLIMEMIYGTKGLSEQQQLALFQDFNVGKSIQHFNQALVKEKLARMRG